MRSEPNWVLGLIALGVACQAEESSLSFPGDAPYLFIIEGSEATRTILRAEGPFSREAAAPRR